jgi:hypothetical protein
MFSKNNEWSWIWFHEEACDKATSPPPPHSPHTLLVKHEDIKGVKFVAIYMHQGAARRECELCDVVKAELVTWLRVFPDLELEAGEETKCVFADIEWPAARGSWLNQTFGHTFTIEQGEVRTRGLQPLVQDCAASPPALGESTLGPKR